MSTLAPQMIGSFSDEARAKRKRRKEKVKGNRGSRRTLPCRRWRWEHANDRGSPTDSTKEPGCTGPVWPFQRCRYKDSSSPRFAVSAFRASKSRQANVVLLPLLSNLVPRQKNNNNKQPCRCQTKPNKYFKQKRIDVKARGFILSSY